MTCFLGNELSAGIIGLGKMGLLHTSTLSVLEGVKVKALCEKSSLISKFARKVLPEVTVVEDMDQLSGKGLDIIFVTTPIPSHFPIIKEIYEKGIAENVFVEKTLSLRASQSEELCSLAEKVSGTTMVGYQRRFAVTFSKARELLEQGAVGKPISFEAHGFSSDFTGVDRGEGATSRGGVYRDLCSHAIDIALWFFGDMRVRQKGGFDQPGFQVTTESGLEGGFRASWSLSGYRMPEIGISVMGTEGSLKANDDTVELVLKEGPSRKWFRQDLDDGVPFLLGGPEYYRQDETFLLSIAGGRESGNTFVQASRVDRIIEEAGVQ